MATNAVSKIPFSGSTKGRGIKVVATATAGTLIHATGNSGATVIDEIWLRAINTDTVDRLLTIEFGGVTSPDDLIMVTIPAKSGLVLVVNGQPLVDGAAGVLNVRAFAAAANVIVVFGFVNRITP